MARRKNRKVYRAAPPRAAAPKNTRRRRASGSGATRSVVAGLTVAAGAGALALVESKAPAARTVGKVDGGLVYGGILGAASLMVPGVAGRALGRLGIGAFAVGTHRSVEAALARRNNADEVSGDEEEYE